MGAATTAISPVSSLIGVGIALFSNSKMEKMEKAHKQA